MSIIDATTGISYTSVSAAILGSNSGDTIDVSAGSYVEDFPKIFHNLTIQGVGGVASFSTPGTPVNGQAILVVDATVTLQNLALSGAAVSDGNGAGVRLETGNLTVINSHIFGNQDGILAGPIPGATITITGSEIDNNGAEDGYSHNIYVGNIGTLTLSGDYIHDALGGHEIKSRAQNNIITNNRIQDQDADTSYSIDLPDGGAATISDNVLQKGENTVNYAYVHFGGETYPSYADSDLSITYNTFINDNTTFAPYAVVNSTNTASDLSGTEYAASVLNNVFYGFDPNQALTLDAFSPPDIVTANVLLPISNAPALDTSSAFAVAEPGSLLLLGVALVAGTLRRRSAFLAHH